MTCRSLYVVVTLAVVAALTSSCNGSAGQHDATPALTPAQLSSSPAPTTSELPKGVLASIPLTCCGTDINGAPQYPTAAFGSLWVVAHRGTNVFRIEPSSDKVIATIDLGDESCTPPTPTPRYLIVDRCNATSDAEIDPRTNQIVGSVPGHIDAYAFGSAWGVTGDFTGLERVNLTTNRATEVRHMDVGPIASTRDEVWVLDEGQSGYVASGIVRIDPKTGHVLGTVHIPEPGYDPYILNAYGAMWVKGTDVSTLVRVDIRTLSVTSYALPGFKPPGDVGFGLVAAGTGSVWIRLNANWVARINPETSKIIARYPSDGLGTGSGVQVAFGSLWVASADGGFLLRDRIDNP